MNCVLNTLGIFIICLIEQIRSDDGVLVKVEQGWLSGQVLQSAVNKSVSYYSFKGIPYAKPPVGPLRFKDPQPPESWDGVRSAKEHGAVCPQMTQQGTTALQSSEDCLFLNVYTPKISNDSLMAVLVFIHGGQFKFLSGNSDTYGPDILVNNKNIVIVTMNYRLDSLGYLCFDNKDVPGNAGFKDQVFALKWVQANIKYFGGDPDRVTLQGQSSGGATVSMHVISPMSKGLFQRAMIFSGVCLSDWAFTRYPVHRAFALAQDLGYSPRNASGALEFLRNVTYDKLQYTTTEVLTSEIHTKYPTDFIDFVAVVEKDFGQERFMVKTPLEALQSGNVNVKELMIGYTDRENIGMMEANELYMETFSKYLEMFIPRGIFEANPRIALDLALEIKNFYYGDKNVSTANMEELISFESNASFVYDTHRYMRRMPSSVSVYFYKFSFYTNWNYYSDVGKPYNLTGAAHSDDLVYLWYPTPLNRTLEENSTEFKLISIYSDMCANFVKYGNPTPDPALLGFTWSKFDNKNRRFLDAKNILSMGTAADERDVQFWEDIMKRVQLTF